MKNNNNSNNGKLKRYPSNAFYASTARLLCVFRFRSATYTGNDDALYCLPDYIVVNTHDLYTSICCWQYINIIFFNLKNTGAVKSYCAKWIYSSTITKTLTKRTYTFTHDFKHLDCNIFYFFFVIIVCFSNR